MAEPYQLIEPAEQLDVETMEKTGFVVPPGWYGLVAASPVGVIGRAKLDSTTEQMRDAAAGLRALGEPDTFSRSDRFEGRRLVRINGGMLVLNFMDYREHDYKNAERQRRWRERQKSNVTRNGVTDHNGVTRVTVTQAEAEAEAEAEKETEKSSSNGPNGHVQAALSLGSDVMQSKTKRKTPLMTNAALEELKANPAFRGIDLTKEAFKFNQWCETNGKQKTKRRFVNWILRIA